MKMNQPPIEHGNGIEHKYFLVEQLLEAINEIMKGQLFKEEKLEKTAFLSQKIIETIANNKE